MAFRSLLKQAALIDEIPQDANVSVIRFALSCFSNFPPFLIKRQALHVRKHDLL